MLNDAQRAELDQNLSGFCEVLPGYWWSAYTGSIEKGFTERQAMELVKTMVLAMFRMNIDENNGDYNEK